MSGIVVAINRRSELRGVSGTGYVASTLADQLARKGGYEIRNEYGPVPIGLRGSAGKIGRMAQSLWWDAWRFASRAPVDIAISPTVIGSIHSAAALDVSILNDLMVLDPTLNFDAAYRAYCAVVWPQALRVTDLIITPSKWTHRKMVERWPFTERKSVVCPLPCKFPLRATSATSEPYDRTILMVGATEPHKDFPLGVAAVSRLRKVTAEPFNLAIIGQIGRGEDTLQRAIDQADPRSQWIMRRVSVTEPELLQLLDQSFALLHPARAEGFGLPPLEAASRSLPVVHSRTTALQEILPLPSLDGHSPEELAFDLAALLDPTTRQQRIALGCEVAARHQPSSYGAAVDVVLQRALRGS